MLHSITHVQGCACTGTYSVRITRCTSMYSIQYNIQYMSMYQRLLYDCYNIQDTSKYNDTLCCCYIPISACRGCLMCKINIEHTSTTFPTLLL